MPRKKTTNFWAKLSTAVLDPNTFAMVLTYEITIQVVHHAFTNVEHLQWIALLDADKGNEFISDTTCVWQYGTITVSVDANPNVQ